MPNTCCFCNKELNKNDEHPTAGYWSAEEDRAGNSIKFVCCPECYSKVVLPEVNRKFETGELSY